ncbi:hypothetical protein H9P43_002795 [Blastocladiella emersonii ATCC 22665]|nr:hypothetical protein H9P43_002795 [Blastocladiella emersonii ATCC 22665]
MLFSDYECISSFVAAVAAAPVSLLVLGALGSLVVLKYTFSLLGLAYNLTLRRGISLKKFGAGTGAWAIITGASDGIGKEFATQLAKAKFNVVLMARTESKLQNLAGEIREAHGVETKVIPFDFSTTDSAAYQQVAAQVAGLNVTVLINNVGTNHAFPVPFLEEEDAVIDRIVDVNISSIMKLTKVIAPKLVAQKKGLILNVGSFAGILPQPLLSVYSASKAYLLTWSQALGKELEPHGVHVQCLSTYFVVSAMSKIRKPTAAIPTAKAYVAKVLGNIGNPGGAPTPFTSTPYPVHGVLNWVLAHVGSPKFWLNYTYKTQVDIRKRALRKQQREAEAKKAQ